MRLPQLVSAAALVLCTSVYFRWGPLAAPEAGAGEAQLTARAWAPETRQPAPEASSQVSLWVSLRDEHGLAPIGAEVELRRLDAHGAHPLLNVRQRSAVSGTVAFEGLQPGRFSVSVRCDGYYDLRQDLTLEPGYPLELPVDLEPILADGRVEVLLESASGTYHGASKVLLTPLRLDEAGLNWGTLAREVTWTRRGSTWTGRCTFEGIPLGEYELTPRGGRFQCWATPASPVRPSTSAVPLRLLDRGDEADLVLRVFDERTGAWVTDYSLEWSGQGCGKDFCFGRSMSQDRRRADPASALEAVPPGVDARWCISHAGYVSRCGSLEEFGEPRFVDGRMVRVADVHLVPARE